MRVIVAGSREGVDFDDVCIAIEKSGFNITELVSGTARGTDRLGEQWAADIVPIKQFPADWAKHGKAAGMIRNKEMAEYAEALIAVWDGKSKGTKHMMRIADMLGLQCFTYYVGEQDKTKS